jgi:excisionase family DNA binding protein
MGNAEVLAHMTAVGMIQVPRLPRRDRQPAPGAVRVTRLHKTHHLLTALEVGEALRVSRATTYRMIESGELVGIRVGGQLRVADSELRRFLVEHQLEPSRERSRQ